MFVNYQLDVPRETFFSVKLIKAVGPPAGWGIKGTPVLMRARMLFLFFYKIFFMCIFYILKLVKQ
jgi:hypothetical protein